MDQIAWKELERIIAAIQEQTAPGAIVRRDHRVRGKSGILRQLDVTLEAKVGLFTVLVVIECKKYKRRVAIKDVADFAERLSDVSAATGIMVSSSGYTAGARAVAARHSLRLLSYREATEIDWSRLFADTTQIYFIVSEIHVSEMTFEEALGDTAEGEVSDDSVLLDGRGRHVTTVAELRDGLGRTLLPARFLGPFSMRVELPEPLFIGRVDTPPINVITLRGDKVAKQHYRPVPAIESGHVLESAEGEGTQPVFRQVSLEGVPWEEIAESHPGRELSLEEYLRDRTAGAPWPFSAQIREVDGVLRVVLTEEGDSAPPAE